MAAQNQAYRRNVAMMREQNQFNADQAQINREWNAQMDSTKYQRTVADMQAAGVNPALAMNGGVTTQAASNSAASASSTPLLDLSSVVQMAMQAKQLRIQEKMADADISLKKADVRVKNADADLKEKDAGVRDEYNRLLLEGQRISNDLTHEQINVARANISRMDSEIALLKKQAATEEERRVLTIAETSLRRATERKTDQEIKNLAQLLPFQKALAAAQTEQARAAAADSFAQAAYQQGLIDEGAITQLVREYKANADAAEQRATAHSIANDIKTGNFFNNPKYFTEEEKARGAKDFMGNDLNAFMKLMSGVGHMISNFFPVSYHYSSIDSESTSTSTSHSTVNSTFNGKKK